MKRGLVALMLLCSLSAHAGGSIDGLGFISVGGGYRWLPNWWFQSKAAEKGTPVVPGVDGGGVGLATFGLGVSQVLAVSISLLGAYTGFELQSGDGSRAQYSSSTFGGMLGGRLMGCDVIVKGLCPYLDVQAGPVLLVIGAPNVTVPEKAVVGLSAAGGAMIRFTPQYGLTLEVRYLQARTSVPDISGINAGGVWFTAMFTFIFPPTIKHELEVPGF